MFKLMGKEINAILGAQTILILTYAPNATGNKVFRCLTILNIPIGYDVSSIYLHTNINTACNNQQLHFM